MKAFRTVKKTKWGPRLEHYQARDPYSLPDRKRRLHAIAERLRGSGRNLADASPKNPTHQREAREG